MLSLLGTYFGGMVVDHFIFGINIKRRVCVISNQLESIVNYVLHDLHSGATLNEIIGAYDRTPKMEMVTIVEKSEHKQLMDYVREVDPKAFVTVYSVSDMRYQPRNNLPNKGISHSVIGQKECVYVYHSPFLTGVPVRYLIRGIRFFRFNVCKRMHNEAKEDGHQNKGGYIIHSLPDQFQPAARLYDTDEKMTVIECRTMDTVSGFCKCMYYAQAWTASCEDKLYSRILMIADFIE